MERQEERYDPLTTILGGDRERRLTAIVRLVGADLFSSEQHFHHSLMPASGGEEERCSAEIISLSGVDPAARVALSPLHHAHHQQRTKEAPGRDYQACWG